MAFLKWDKHFEVNNVTLVKRDMLTFFYIKSMGPSCLKFFVCRPTDRNRLHYLREHFRSRLGFARSHLGGLFDYRD